MKTGTSSLNPDAQSYIPLSKRAVDAKHEYSLTEKEDKSGNETLVGLHSKETAQGQHQSKGSQNYIAHGTVTLEDGTLKDNPVHGSYGSSSKNSKEMTEKQIRDEEFYMDLAYLQMTFPGLSDESLSEVYLANNGDLEASVDMLSELEPYTDHDSSEKLLDSSDIANVAESASYSEDASLKLKKVAGEVAGSSVRSAESAFIT